MSKMKLILLYMFIYLKNKIRNKSYQSEIEKEEGLDEIFLNIDRFYNVRPFKKITLLTNSIIDDSLFFSTYKLKEVMYFKLTKKVYIINLEVSDFIHYYKKLGMC